MIHRFTIFEARGATYEAIQVLRTNDQGARRLTEGHQGPPGPPGAAGPPGPPGGSGYTHTQAVASAVWTITHNLARYPSVTVVDSAGTTVWGRVDYLSANALTVTFSAGFAGKAYLN